MRRLIVVLTVLSAALVVAASGGDNSGGSGGAASSAFLPYFPRTSGDLLSHVTDTLFSLCRQHKITLDVAVHEDIYPHVGPEAPSVAIVQASHGKPSRRVLIVCGESARGFLTTDVCMEFLERLCAGTVDDHHNTEYAVVPFMNERGREFNMHLWPEYRGAQPRSWEQLIDTLPIKYQRLLSEVSANSDRRHNDNSWNVPYFACFDGSYRMTRLEHNWPYGWMERLNLDDLSNFNVDRMPTVVQDSLLEDRLSINGRMSFSDPETRILKSFLNVFNPSIVVQVSTGKEAILSPFDSPVLSESSLSPGSPQLEAYQSSLGRAEHLAATFCPNCLTGVASVARQQVANYRSGTLPDYAIDQGVETVLILQIVQQSRQQQAEEIEGTGRRQSPPNDCLAPYVPTFSDTAVKIVKRWAELLMHATKAK